MKFLFLFLIISLNLPAQEIVGKWEVIGYEDDLVYYNKTKDSINFKIQLQKSKWLHLKV